MFEPSADSRIAAKRSWDIYASLLNEGFSETQAMNILLAMISGAFTTGGNE